MTTSNCVLLSDLAQEFGHHRTSTHKYVKKLGILPMRVRSPGSGGQKVLAITMEEAEYVRDLRKEEGFQLRESADKTLSSGNGYFYIIQLIPEIDVSRIKLGFTTKVNERLAAHRTTCPGAAVLRQWPCRFVWEVSACACATRLDCKSLSNEVYTCSDLDGLIERLGLFFANMPPPEFVLEQM